MTYLDDLSVATKEKSFEAWLKVKFENFFKVISGGDSIWGIHVKETASGFTLSIPGKIKQILEKFGL